LSELRFHAKMRCGQRFFSVDILPYLTLPYLRGGQALTQVCPVLRPYQLGPMRIPECNHKVTGSGYKAVDGCEAVNKRL